MAGIGDLLDRKTRRIDGSVGCNKYGKQFKQRRVPSGLERSGKNKRPQSLAAF
jgi:hypothetical protein